MLTSCNLQPKDTAIILEELASGKTVHADDQSGDTYLPSIFRQNDPNAVDFGAAVATGYESLKYLGYTDFSPFFYWSEYYDQNYPNNWVMAWSKYHKGEDPALVPSIPDRIIAMLPADYSGKIIICNECTVESQGNLTPSEIADMIMQLRDALPNATFVIGNSAVEAVKIEAPAVLKALHQKILQRYPKESNYDQYIAARDKYFSNMEFGAHVYWGISWETPGLDQFGEPLTDVPHVQEWTADELLLTLDANLRREFAAIYDDEYAQKMLFIMHITEAGCLTMEAQAFSNYAHTCEITQFINRVEEINRDNPYLQIRYVFPFIVAQNSVLPTEHPFAPIFANESFSLTEYGALVKQMVQDERPTLTGSFINAAGKIVPESDVHPQGLSSQLIITPEVQAVFDESRQTIEKQKLKHQQFPR